MMKNSRVKTGAAIEIGDTVIEMVEQYPWTNQMPVLESILFETEFLNVSLNVL